MPHDNTKRKAISNSVRFEIFKRDKFTCQYCGRSAPDIVLRVDHIKPVKEGGTNEITNLITSCFECNSGKRDKLLSDDSALKKQQRQLELLQERREQIEMMLKWHEELKKLEDDVHTYLKNYWEQHIKGYSLNTNGIQIIKKLAKAYPFEEILKAMDTAAEGYLLFEDDRPTLDSCDTAFNTIHGILRVNKGSESDPDLRDLLYIRGIIRNRLNYYNPGLTLDWLKAARSWGASIRELKEIACTTRNWSSFSDEIDELIDRQQKEYDDDTPAA